MNIDADRLAAPEKLCNRRSGKTMPQEFEDTANRFPMDSMDDDPVTATSVSIQAVVRLADLIKAQETVVVMITDGNDDDVDEVESVQYTPTVYTFGEPTTFTPTARF
jgi:hypothetical protein